MTTKLEAIIEKIRPDAMSVEIVSSVSVNGPDSVKTMCFPKRIAWLVIEQDILDALGACSSVDLVEMLDDNIVRFVDKESIAVDTDGDEVTVREILIMGFWNYIQETLYAERMNLHANN